MQPAPTMRPAESRDEPAVVELVNRAYRSEGGWTTEAGLVGGARIEPSGFRELLERPGSVVLVAERGARVVGCVHLQRSGPRECFLGMLSVAPADQGSGRGRAILAEAEAFARDRWGTEVMAMHVVTARAELVAWYERRGYRRTGQVEPFEPRAGVTFLRGPLAFERLEKRLAP